MRKEALAPQLFPTHLPSAGWSDRCDQVTATRASLDNDIAYVSITDPRR